MKSMITLFIIFFILKMTDTIDWSWIWVTSPLWLPISLIILIGILSVVLLLLIDNSI
jgi:hypothetical protein